MEDGRGGGWECGWEEEGGSVGGRGGGWECGREEEGGSVGGRGGGWEEEGGSVALLLLHAATLTGTC